MLDTHSTIAAIATAPGEAGVGIVRVSGPEALPIAARVFAPLPLPADIVERHLYYGSVRDESGERIDTGLCAFMRGPRSYTGEDTIELNCHGGTLVLGKVLQAVVKSGARLAEPGEFTKRAFLNGKLDLAQAEAVADVISAQTGLSLACARARLEGGLSRKVNDLKEALLAMIAGLEAELDFPEDEVGSAADALLLDALAPIETGIKGLLSTWEEGRILKEGFSLIIAGRPNVGKSSLLNRLLKEERAIVTPHPGTTRDLIEEVLNIRGVPVRLIDTAGLRDTADPVESIGISAARERIKEAQGVILLISLKDFGDADRELLQGLNGKRLIIAANKADIAAGEERHTFSVFFGGAPIVFISALTGDGIEELKDRVYELAAGRPFGAVGEAGPGVAVSSLRHRDALERALERLEEAKAAVTDGLPKELIAVDLRFALERLGEITGETTTEDILDRIFSDFCIGK